MASEAVASAATAASGAIAQPAASRAQFSELPFKRDTPSGTAPMETFGWTILILSILAAAIFVAARRRLAPALNASATRWLRTAPPSGSLPKLIGRTSLAPHATLHTVEWNGEELLLGCTAQSVTLVARRVAEDTKEHA